jgi:hypothetical protein
MKVLFNKFHRSINLMVLLSSNLGSRNQTTHSKFWIPAQNGEMKVLFNKCHRRLNLVALLFGNLGSKNKTAYSEFWILEILRVLPYKIWSLKVFYTYSLQYVESIHAPDLCIRFFFLKIQEIFTKFKWFLIRRCST